MREIRECTVFSAPDNINIDETRENVLKKKYNEGDDFCNNLFPNYTFLILVKLLLYFQWIVHVLGTSGPLPVRYATMERKL